MKVLLEDILKAKEEEVKQLLYEAENTRLLKAVRGHFFFEKLIRKGFHVIAEIKKRSPSAGPIANFDDPASQAFLYEAGGASAISVVTDQKYFGGSIEDLRKVAASISLPVLRKDFLIHPIQIEETLKTGASAVLLIAAALKEKLSEMVERCQEAKLDALVEIHNEEELEKALKAKAKIIGVNNRNLKTMEVSLRTAEELARLIPDSIIKIAESGIKSAKDAKRMKQAGYQAILVGESLMRSENPSKLIEELRLL